MTIVNTILIVLFIFLVIWFFNNSGEFFPSTIPFLLIVLMNVVSSAYIEEGVYMADLGKYSHATGGTFRLIVLYTIFVYVLANRFKKSRRVFRNIKEKIMPENTIRFILWSVTLITGYLLIDIAISGSIFTNPSISRFNYMSTYSTLPMVSLIGSFRNTCAFFCGLAFCETQRKRYKLHALVCLVMLFLSWYLIGNQFTGLLHISIYFFIPRLTSMLFNNEKVINFKNISLTSIAVIVALIPKLSYFQNHGIYGLNGSAYNSAISLLLYRAFGLQSDVWWELDRQLWEAEAGIDLNHTITEFASLFRLTDQSKSGIFYLMSRVMPASEYTRFIDGNGTLCSGHPALEVAMWGYLGAALAMVIEALLFYALIRALTRSIIEKHLIDSLVLVTLLSEVVKVFNVGGFFWLSNTIPLLCIVYLIITRGFHIRGVRIGQKSLRF